MSIFNLWDFSSLIKRCEWIRGKRIRICKIFITNLRILLFNHDLFIFLIFIHEKVILILIFIHHSFLLTLLNIDILLLIKLCHFLCLLLVKIWLFVLLMKRRNDFILAYKGFFCLREILFLRSLIKEVFIVKIYTFLFSFLELDHILTWTIGRLFF